MRKAFAAIAAGGVLAAARRTTSPFVGEHADKQSIEHGDGRVSMHLKPTKGGYNKYESMYVRDDLFPERKSYTEYFSDLVFGKSELPSRASQYSGKTHKLGQTADSLDLVNSSGTMWTGPIVMGGTTMLDVVYDTGSDWLVIESETCSNCEGNKYDLADSAGTPVKTNSQQTERNYGSASLQGYEYKDKVCVTLNVCLDEF